jgi:hypothetical protein
MKRPHPIQKLILITLFVLIGGQLTTVEEVQAHKTQAIASTPPNFVVAFIGDQAMYPRSRAVLSLIKNEGADMVLHQGDFDYVNDPDGWDQQINNILGPNFPYFATVGNHDLARWPDYQRKLQERLKRIPDAQCTGDLGVKSACHYQGLFFILSGVGILGSDHEAYIRDQLAADNSIWSICTWHANQTDMQVGSKKNAVGWGPYKACREGGAIIATGHEHSYSRTRTLSNMRYQIVDPSCVDDRNTPDPDVCVSEGSTFSFVSGIAGRSIRDQDRCLPTTYPYGCKGEWAKIYTSDQNAQYGALFIVFNVNGDPKKAWGYFKNIDGVVIDSFYITNYDPTPFSIYIPIIKGPIPNAQLAYRSLSKSLGK